MTFKQKLNKAFVELRKNGYIAKQNFWCCQSCAWANIPKEAKKIVFYHKQDVKYICEGKVYIAWAGNGMEICHIFSKHGMRYEWDGSNDKRILIVNIED